MFDSDRQLAYPDAGGVEDGVGDGRGDANGAEFADFLGAERAGVRVVILDEGHVDVTDVAHPNRRAPSSRQARSGREENGCPVLGSRSGSLRSRSTTTGSIPSRWASSSIAHSTANIPGPSCEARIGVGCGRSHRWMRVLTRSAGVA